MAVVVFFGAHADDVELGAGGTCAKLCAAGFDVRIVVATDELDARLASTRRNEATAAATILGVPRTRVYFLALSDGHLRCNRDSVAQVRALFSEKKIYPDAIFTHTEADSHQDHVELTRIVKAAFRRVGLFKYCVSNSAIASHFRPSVRSDISAFSDIKAAALSRHKSQILVGRVSPRGVSQRYCVDQRHEHLEDFELEIQHGAAGFLHVLDCANDAPFSRLWLPLCARGEISVLAPPTRHCASHHRHKRVVSRAPSDLRLVTQLQTALIEVMHTRLSNRPSVSLTVAEADDDDATTLPCGTSLILGGPAVNPAARPLLGRMGNLRFRPTFPSRDYHGRPIIDTHTGRVFEPSFTEGRGGRIELARDYGLLTIARVKHGRAGHPSLVISAMGVHDAGAAAAFSCLLRSEYVNCIVDDSRRVIDGAANWAQWLVPSDGDGAPITAHMQGEVNDRHHARPRSAGVLRASRRAHAS